MSYFFEGKITTIEEIDQQEFARGGGGLRTPLLFQILVCEGR